VTDKPRVSAWRWAAWLAVLAPALVVFYVLLTPVWVAIRVTRWLVARRDFTPAKHRSWHAAAAPGQQRTKEQ
jgi:hypothetical protein